MARNAGTSRYRSPRFRGTSSIYPCSSRFRLASANSRRRSPMRVELFGGQPISVDVNSSSVFIEARDHKRLVGPWVAEFALGVVCLLPELTKFAGLAHTLHGTREVRLGLFLGATFPPMKKVCRPSADIAVAPWFQKPLLPASFQRLFPIRHFFSRFMVPYTVDYGTTTGLCSGKHLGWRTGTWPQRQRSA